MKRLTPASVTMMMFVMVGLLVVAYFAKGIWAQQPPPARAETRNVPMAIADLEPGTVVTAAHLGLGPMRVDKQIPEMLLNNRVIVGRVVKERIRKAMPILAGQLYPPGEFPPLKVGKGMRAVSINVIGSAAIVDGLIKPGEFVDVHFTPRTSGDERMRNGLTLTLLKGVRVIAINRNYSASAIAGGGNTVTLELTAEQANIVLLCQDKGLLNLTYTPDGKGPGGIAVANEDRAFLDEILGLTPLPKPEPPFAVELYRGRGLTTMQFRDDRRVAPSSIDNDLLRPRPPINADPPSPKPQPLTQDSGQNDVGPRDQSDNQESSAQPPEAGI